MTYPEFVVETFKNEAEKHGSARKASIALGMDPAYFSRIVTGRQVPVPKTFSKLFPTLEWPEFSDTPLYFINQRRTRMDIDVTKFTKEELEALLTSVKSELSQRPNEHRKSDTLTYSNLRDIFKDTLEAAGISEDDQGEFLKKLESSVYALCDYAMGNYIIKPVRKSRRKNPAMERVNHVIERDNWLRVDFSTYKNMCDDILEVVKKYKEDRKDGSTIVTDRTMQGTGEQTSQQVS